MKLALLGLVGLVGLLAACGSSAPKATPAPRPTSPVAPSSPSPSVPQSPPPSDGFAGPGSFNLDWDDVTDARANCPAGHPTATCYTGTGKVELPVVGQVMLVRTIIVGEPATVAPPPPDCVTAKTNGTITNPTGTMAFTATGVLCGRRSAFTVSSSSGSGSMARYVLYASIVNMASAGSDAVTESWFGEIIPIPTPS